VSVTLDLVKRRRKWWAGVVAIAALAAEMVTAAAGTASKWSLGSLNANPAAAVAAWAAALVLVVAALAAVSHKGRHAGWFHPLSLPLATLAVMSLGAPVWVYFTRQSVGLLYDAGHQPALASTMAVAVSTTACDALALVVAGYMIGVGAVLAISRQAAPTSTVQRPAFRYRDMRQAGTALMTVGAVSRLGVAVLARGATYGTGQLQYGLPSILAAGAGTALFAGLILVTLAPPHAAKPTRLRNLMLGREWAALSLYFLAVALSGERAGLIAPAVYLAWVYSTQVRVIPIKWIVAGVLVALIGGAVIANYRQGGGLSPGSPASIAQQAMGDVSSPAWLTQQTVTRVPSTTAYLRGSTYLAAAESQLPGPAARATGAPARAASAVFRNLIGFYNPNQGFAESYPSEAYLNFGLAGCLGAGLFLGALMAWAWRKRREAATRARDLLYPVLLAGLIYGFRSDALTQIKDVLYPMLAVSVLMGWYRLRLPAIR
jgi:hypothetical protein